jgi:hypothetical protein
MEIARPAIRKNFPECDPDRASALPQTALQLLDDFDRAADFWV